MKSFIRMSWMLVAAVVLGLTSCLNETEDKNSVPETLPGNVASVAEQVEAMKEFQTQNAAEAICKLITSKKQFR